MQRAVGRRHLVVVHVAPVAPDLGADLEAVEVDSARVQHLAGRRSRTNRRRSRRPSPPSALISSASGRRASARSVRTGRPCARARRGHRASGSAAKSSAGQRRLDDPGLLGELGLELAGAPAGVAGVDAPAAHHRRRGRSTRCRRRRSRRCRRPPRPRRRGSSKSASTTSACGCTGPPMNTGSPSTTPPARARRRRPSISEGRLRTTPIAPSVAVLGDQHDRRARSSGR